MVCPSNTFRQRPVSTSQSRTVRSCAAESTRRWSALHWTVLIVSRCPLKIRRHLPVSTSHSRMVSSRGDEKPLISAPCQSPDGASVLESSHGTVACQVPERHRIALSARECMRAIGSEQTRVNLVRPNIEFWGEHLRSYLRPFPAQQTTELLCPSADRGQDPTCAQCDQKCRQRCYDRPKPERK